MLRSRVTRKACRDVVEYSTSRLRSEVRENRPHLLGALHHREVRGGFDAVHAHTSGAAAQPLQEWRWHGAVLRGHHLDGDLDAGSQGPEIQRRRPLVGEGLGPRRAAQHQFAIPSHLEAAVQVGLQRRRSEAGIGKALLEAGARRGAIREAGAPLERALGEEAASSERVGVGPRRR